MKKFVVMILLVLISSMVWAAEIKVTPGTNMLGWSNFNGSEDYTTLTNTGYTTFGNNNIFVKAYTTVVKFSLADFNGVAESATLSLWRYCATSGVYVQLQHTTQQTAGATVTHADVADLTFENVGSAEDFTVTSNQFDWDVTSYVNADLAAGYDYITFLVKAVDSNGNPVGANMYGNICSKDVYAPYEPTLDITTVDCSAVIADLTQDCKVNYEDLDVFCQEWLKCTMPNGIGCDQLEPEQTGTIVQGVATIDANLSDWSDQDEWVYVENTIYGTTPPDISVAKFALRWDSATHSIYGAVVVNDANHIFTDGYGDSWDASDRIEVYCQGDAAGGAYDDVVCEEAQQYFIGHGTSGSWASLASGWDILSDFTYATSVDGNNIIYEFKAVQYDNFGEDFMAVNPTVISDLTAGKTIRFDIVIDGRWGINAADIGVLAANTNTGRATNADNFAIYTLVESAPCGAWGRYDADLNQDCTVNFADFADLAEDWLKQLRM